MKKINISTKKYPNKFVLVDDDDFEYLNHWKWQYHKAGYAYRTSTTVTNIYMHRVINKTPAGLVTDHINRNRLDNRKCNLRTLTRRLNCLNSDRKVSNKSGHRGISLKKSTGKWEASIHFNYKKIHLGYFNKLEEALLVRKRAEGIYHAI